MECHSTCNQEQPPSQCLQTDHRLLISDIYCYHGTVAVPSRHVYSTYYTYNSYFFLSQAATCFGLFTENSPFIETGALPEDFWPMILAAMSIQYAGLMVESVVAKLKGPLCPIHPILYSLCMDCKHLHRLYSLFFLNYYFHIPQWYNTITPGVDVSTVLLPSYNILFNYGPRSLYLNMPKNRNDLFDMSFAGTLTTLGLSMVIMRKVFMSQYSC